MTRTVHTLRRGAATMEVAVDRGAVETAQGAAAEPFAEVEIELREGASTDSSGHGDAPGLGDLFGLARALGEAVPLRLGVTTKAERGFAHVDGAGPRVRKAEPVALDPAMGAGPAFQAVARACLRHLRLNEPLLRAGRDSGAERDPGAGRDPEALHQVRVAIRRLRSAMSLFKPVIAHPDTERLRDALRARVAVLGTARNLDVLLLHTLPGEMERRPEAGAAFLALRARLEAERAQAYDAVAAMLDDPAWRGLVLDAAALVEDGAWMREPAGAPARAEPVADFAARTLEKRRRRVTRRAAASGPGRGLRPSASRLRGAGAASRG